MVIGVIAALIAVLFMELHKNLNRLLMKMGLHVSIMIPSLSDRSR